MSDNTIGFALCGSFCTYTKAMVAFRTAGECLHQGHPHLLPGELGNRLRFGTAASHIRQAEELCGAPPRIPSPKWNPLVPKAPGRSGGSALHRKHPGQAGPWHCRRSCNHGGEKVTCAMAVLFCWPYPPMTVWRRWQRTSAASWRENTSILFLLVRTIRTRSPPVWLQTSAGSPTLWQPLWKANSSSRS